MNLVQVKFPSPKRILNVWRKSYESDSECMCTMSEEDAEFLPLTYKVISKVESKIERVPEIIKEEPINQEPMEELKKVIKEPKEDIKKVVVQEKSTIAKDK